nr:hypothetical protein [Tanacetum cinerariifolium]
MASLANKAILSGAENRPLMLEKDMYDSWRSRMEMYILNRQHDRIILESVEHGPLLWHSVTEEGVTRLKKYSELSAAEAIQADSPQIKYAPISHHPSELSSPETGLVVSVFQKGDDPINAINHMMSFLTSVVTSRVTIQPIQGRQNQMSAGSSRPFTSGLGGTSGRQREYYACATGEAAPKPRVSARKKKGTDVERTEAEQLKIVLR